MPACKALVACHGVVGLYVDGLCVFQECHLEGVQVHEASAPEGVRQQARVLRVIKVQVLFYQTSTHPQFCRCP
jgi:hypothetical protein